MTIINHSQMKYKERKETFLFALDELKQEFLNVNKWLALKAFDANRITTFIALIASFGVEEPFIRPQYVKKFTFFAVIVIIIGLINIFQNNATKR